jgi:hypothetical protein
MVAGTVGTVAGSRILIPPPAAKGAGTVGGTVAGTIGGTVAGTIVPSKTRENKGFGTVGTVGTVVPRL